MKRIILTIFLFLASFSCVYGAYAYKTLNVRKGSTTYSHRLYTSPNDTGVNTLNHNLKIRVGSTTLYAGLFGDTSIIASNTLYIYKNATSSVAPFAYPYINEGCVDGTLFDVISNGNMYVLNTTNRTVKIYSTSFQLLNTWNLGYLPGWIVIDGSDNIFIFNTSNNYTYKYTSAGTYVTYYNVNSMGSFFQNGYFYISSGSRINKYNATSWAFINNSATFTNINAWCVDLSGSENVIWTTSSRLYKSTWSGSLLLSHPISFNNLSRLCNLTNGYFLLRDNYGHVILNSGFGGIMRWETFSETFTRDMRNRNDVLHELKLSGTLKRYDLSGY